MGRATGAYERKLASSARVSLLISVPSCASAPQAAAPKRGRPNQPLRAPSARSIARDHEAATQNLQSITSNSAGSYREALQFVET